MIQRQLKYEASGIFALAVFGWAFPGVFVRLMPHLSPLPLVTLRLAMGELALLPFLLFPHIRKAAFVAVRTWRCWVVSLGMLLYYGVATPAFLYAPVGKVALIIASAPLFAVILRLSARHVVTRNELIGAALAVSGVLLMALPSITPLSHFKAVQWLGVRLNGATLGSTPSHSSPYGPEWLGILLAVTAAIAAAAYAMGNRTLVSRGESPGAIVQVGLTFTLGSLFLPCLLTVSSTTLFDPHMAWVIPLGAISTAIPTVAVAASSHRMSPIAVTLINPVTSVFANLVAGIFIAELPTVGTVLGGVLVISAVVVSAQNVGEKAG